MLAGLLLESGGVTAAGRGGMEVVEVSITRNGEVLGRPKLAVAAGGTATTRVDGERGYALALTLRDDPRSPARRRVDAALSLPDRGAWRLVASPVIETVANVDTRTEIADGESGTIVFVMRIVDDGR